MKEVEVLLEKKHERSRSVIRMKDIKEVEVCLG